MSLKIRWFLEEYMYNIQNGVNSEFSSIIDALAPSETQYEYLKKALKEKLCIVSNDIFREFTEMSNEIITRIRINKITGVVDEGALWTEEYLPTDTFLYFPVFTVDSRKSGTELIAEDVMKLIKSVNSYIQVGGNEAVGKGFVRIN